LSVGVDFVASVILNNDEHYKNKSPNVLHKNESGCDSSNIVCNIISLIVVWVTIIFSSGHHTAAVI